MVGWYHQFNGREIRQTLGDSEGQGWRVLSMRSQRIKHGLATEQHS